MIRSILVHLDASPSSGARLLAARELGRRFGAAVTAAFGVGQPAGQHSYLYSAQAASDDGLDDLVRTRREQARRRLRRHLREPAPPTAWIELPGAALARRFVEEAAYADLLLLGQPERDDADLGPPEGFAADVSFASGRPTLVLPARPRRGKIGRRVLVAWNGSAQAARAVSAALPFLREADAVDVVGWAPASLAAPVSGVDVGTFLRRHGVEANLQPRPHARDVAAAIAVEVEARVVDLLVMGCYGHARWRERVLGGATRTLLATPPVPTLLVH